MFTVRKEEIQATVTFTTDLPSLEELKHAAIRLEDFLGNDPLLRQGTWRVYQDSGTYDVRTHSEEVTITINVHGDGSDSYALADAVIQQIEKRGARLQSTPIRMERR